MTDPYFEGDLVQNEMLRKIARQRRRKYHEITVPKSDLDSYLKDGWEPIRPYKRSVRLRKAKRVDELLEDEAWLLFKNMGFTEMNKDRNFKIQAGPIKKQIDVFARDEDHTFVVECKASVQQAPISRKDILEISSLKEDIAESIKEKYNNRRMRVSFVIATRGIRWTANDESLAKKAKIFIWREPELEYYDKLVKHLGSAAKFQIYSILFPKARIPPARRIKVPAIRGGKGKEKYYTFVIQPEKLLQVAYVHHRRSTPEELLGSYQRMLKKSRLTKINAFISRGGHFPNNIIVNFNRPPKFERKERVGDIVFGILEFPPYYASAWIIDGQHRLYGYADNDKKSTDTVPVVAFDRLDVKHQAKLFVDINKEQKRVGPNLLWDLFPDIYHDSEEPEHQLLRAISLVVKKLNLDSDSPLRDHISIPSVSPKEPEITNLTMATVCDALKDSNLVHAEGDLLYKTDYDTTVDFASQRLKAYFGVVAKAFPEDWGKGDHGLLCTNIGIRILTIVLKQLLKYLDHVGQRKVYTAAHLGRFKAQAQRLLSPALAKVKAMNDKQRDDIREASTKGLVMRNAQQWTWWIKEENEGFGLEILRDWAPPIPEGQTDDDIEYLLKDTERQLRVFIPQQLKAIYGAKWFGRIDKEIRDYMQKKREEEIAKARWKEAQLRSLPAEKKMRFTTTGQLKKIIDDNWAAFEEAFVDQSYALAQLRSFVDLRNVYAHHEEDECDVVIKNLGYWATRWVRKCMGLNKVEEAA